MRERDDKIKLIVIAWVMGLKECGKEKEGRLYYIPTS